MSRIDNSFRVIGNLGTDVETRTMTSGNPVATLNLGVDASYKKEGERVERTTWLELTVYYKPLIEVLQKHTGKGSQLAVEGSIEKRVWESKDRKDSDGKPLKDSRYEFVVSRVKFLGRPKDGASDQPSEASVPDGEGQGTDYNRMLDEAP